MPSNREPVEVSEPLPTVVIGAGVVGLATARALALTGRDVIVLEADERIGQGVTSRSSEVVHAGLYYPPGSLKARTCVRGRQLLYAYCRTRRVPHRNTGKLVVATSEAEIGQLRAIRANARASGVDDLRWLSAREARALEPELHCVAALWSPSSGIVDSHALLAELEADLARAGGMVVPDTRVQRVIAEDGRRWLDIAGGPSVEASYVVIAAGLGALELARGCLPGSMVPPGPTRLAKGTWYALVGVKPPFERLIYPIPEAAGLGIHATVDLEGRVRFGPDVEWVDTLDYAATDARRDAFEAAVRDYWPGLPDGALVPTYAGIRPKIVGPGQPNADFVVLGPGDHGVAGVIALLGIESPGLTASLALAEHVVLTMDGPDREA